MTLGKAKHLLGRELELACSRNWHRRAIPLLVSPMLLRRRGCGQVDVSCIESNPSVTRIIECKSRGVISQAQYRRLLNSANFLSTLLGKSARLQFISSN